MFYYVELTYMLSVYDDVSAIHSGRSTAKVKVVKHSRNYFFWHGFTSILDLYPDTRSPATYYWKSGTGQDWKAIGNDLRRALSSYDEQRTGKTESGTGRGTGTGQSAGKHS